MPPAAAALDVPTAGVPTYRVDSPLRDTEACSVDATHNGSRRGARRTIAALPPRDGSSRSSGSRRRAAGTGSPSSAVISSSLSGARLLRLRRACSAAMEDLLHFLPAATCLATSGEILPAAAAQAAGALESGRQERPVATGGAGRCGNGYSARKEPPAEEAGGAGAAEAPPAAVPRALRPAGSPALQRGNVFLCQQRQA